MPWTNSDLATIDQAIASGIRTIRFSDGKSQEYASIDDLKKARADIQLYILSQTGAPNRQLRIFTDKGFGS